MAIIGLIGLLGGVDSSATFSDMLGLLMFILLFGLLTLSQLISYFRTFGWKVDRYWYGTITDMHIMKSSKGKTKGYVIIADIGNGK